MNFFKSWMSVFIIMKLTLAKIVVTRTVVFVCRGEELGWRIMIKIMGTWSAKPAQALNVYIL